MKAVLVAAQVLAILSYCNASPLAHANDLGKCSFYSYTLDQSQRADTL
jgi:hypothetical protein